MEPSNAPTSAPDDAHPARSDHGGGRVAVPEVAELLHLQRPAAAVAAAAVVLLGLLVALVAPGLLPANAFTGVVVGLLAVLAAVATAVLLDGRDPVVRGPRHLRRDGHTVLARIAGPDPVRHGGPLLEAIERRLAAREHLAVVLTGDGADPSEIAVALGRGAAAAGRTSLVVDLRAGGAPGIADVGSGAVRLGEAALLDHDRPYAWIGAGADRAAAAHAAANVVRRPPRDLQLLLVVAPEAATHVPELLRACERTVLLVGADQQHRAMVTARIDALARAGATVEAVVVGGARVDGELRTITPLVAHGAGSPPSEEPSGAEPTDSSGAPVPPAPEPTHDLAPTPDPTPVPEPEPAPDPTAAPESEPAPAQEATSAPASDPIREPAPGPDPDPVREPDPISDPPSASDPGTAADPDQTAGPGAMAGGGPTGAPPKLPTRRPRPADDSGPSIFDEAPATGAPSLDGLPPSPHDQGTSDEPTLDEPTRDEPGLDEPTRDEPTRDEEQRGMDDTGPMPRVELSEPPTFRVAAPGHRSTAVDGMTDTDALHTTAALAHLLAERDGD